jgi:hypothetical protein
MNSLVAAMPFSVTIQQQNPDIENSSMTAKFHLVDLAASEKAEKTKATGGSKKE